MPHAPSAVASCEWGYDAVARLRRAVGSTLGSVGASEGVEDEVRSRGHAPPLLREAVMSLLPDSIRKLCDKCTLFSNRTLICERKRLFLYSETM